MAPNSERLLVGLLVVVTFVAEVLSSHRRRDPKIIAMELIRDNGYPLEEHNNIPTEDGYLLDVQRIPYGLEGDSAPDRPAALLMHGLLGSSENWLVTGPEHGLGFVLADHGYDVWLGNARGSTHSRKHERLNPDVDADFWAFSWHEIGSYDLPAIIDHIVNATGQEKIYYVGHSQGATSFFVMASERPDYNDKIRVMVALAPAVFMGNMGNSLLKIMAAFESELSWLFSLMGINEFMPNNDLMTAAGRDMCNAKAPSQEVCANVLFLIAGYDSEEMNKTALPVVLSASPAGSSIRQIAHFAQAVNSGEFRQYNYGTLVNLMKYDSSTPPKYGLDRVTAPVAIMYGKNDRLVSVKGVERLIRELPHVVYAYLVSHEKFNHLDFLWAKDVVQMVYGHIFDLLKKY